MTKESRWGTLLVLLTGAAPALAQYPYPGHVQYYSPQYYSPQAQVQYYQQPQARPYYPQAYSYPQARYPSYPQQPNAYYSAAPTYYTPPTYSYSPQAPVYKQPMEVQQAINPRPSTIVAPSLEPSATPYVETAAPFSRLPQAVVGTSTSRPSKFAPPEVVSDAPIFDGAESPPTHSSCADGSCAPPVADCAKKTCPDVRGYAFADFLYMSVASSNLPFAQVRDGVTITAVPRGDVRIADPEWDNGVRVGGGFRVGQNSYIQGSLLWYESESTDQITAPRPFVIHSLVTFPGTLNTAATSFMATSQYSFDQRIADATFKHVFGRGENYDVAVLVGGRYAFLDQNFSSQFQILRETTVTTSIEFQGGGPGVGFEGDWRMRCGLFAYGRSMFHLLLGRFDSRYEQRNTFVGQQALVESTEDRVVPMLDLEAGVGWMSPKGRLRLSSGFYLNGWYNTLTTPVLIQGVRSSNFTTNGDNYRDELFFGGYTARLEYRF